MDDKIVSLAKYRFEKAKEALEIAISAFEKKLFRSSLSNSYYSIFHSVRVLFALEKIDSKTHKGVVHLLNIHFIKNGKLPHKMNEILTDASEMRLDSDYEDFYVANGEEAKEQIENAEFFLNEIISFVKEHYNVDLNS